MILISISTSFILIQKLFQLVESKAKTANETLGLSTFFTKEENISMDFATAKLQDVLVIHVFFLFH